MTHKKLKILHVINHYQEKFGYQENYLAYNQNKLGHEAIIITSDHYYPFPDYEKSVKNVLGKRKIGVGSFYDNGVKIIRKKSYFQILNSPNLVWFSIKKELLTFRPDIIHVHNPTNLFLFEIFFFKNKLGYKIFIDSHYDYLVENNKYPFLKFFYFLFWRLIYNKLGQNKKVAKFLPITESSKNWLIEKLKINPSSMIISRLGVDTETMAYDNNADKEFRKKYHIGDKIILVNAGKQYEKKNIEWIIKVAIEASKINKQIFLLLIGSAGDRYNKKIMKLLSRLNKDQFLRLPFLRRDILQKAYSASDIGIWPGVPSNTIQEAMLCEVALILPENNIVGHLINKNGLKENDNIHKAAKFIITCVNNKTKLDSYKKQSKEIAFSYSWSKITSDLNVIYTSN